MALLERGQQRFDIYCSPCHSRVGDGNGMIVQRGFPHPPSYFAEYLMKAPNQHFYDVITHGYGAMYPYATRVAPADRWAIIAYIRALQASENARLADVPADKRQSLAMTDNHAWYRLSLVSTGGTGTRRCRLHRSAPLSTRPAFSAPGFAHTCFGWACRLLA